MGPEMVLFRGFLGRFILGYSRNCVVRNKTTIRTLSLLRLLDNDVHIKEVSMNYSGNDFPHKIEITVGSNTFLPQATSSESRFSDGASELVLVGELHKPDEKI